jgi:FkbM family methyltransferase
MKSILLNKFLRAYSRPRLLAKWLKRRSGRSQSSRFISDFVKQGDLVFDIGANYGWKTELFVALGARVIAVEPQRECVDILNRKFKSSHLVHIENLAVGANETVGHIWKSDVRNQLSSMSREWISAVKKSGRFRHFEWSSMEAVTVTTLDHLIQQYGVPDFCKIDTEGYESEVIAGLTQPLKAASIEYHIEFMDSARKCVERLANLGSCKFNYTLGEAPALASKEWLDADQVIRTIKSMNVNSLQGDIYVRAVNEADVILVGYP